MSRPELDVAVQWAADEGWIPGLDDADPFFAADAEGFYIAILDGEPAACISAVNYGDRFGFVGFYICRPDLRGRGIGLSTWQAALSRYGDMTVGLDGVVEQQDNYRKSGFAFAHNNLRYRGFVTGDGGAATSARPVSEADIDDLLAYDRLFFPASRPAFLRQWLTGSGTRTAMVVRRDGDVEGYGVIRACREGHKIGPLFADDPEAADMLFTALAAKAAGGPVILDVAGPNTDGVALAERYGMETVFQTARMYRGPAPDLPLDRIYGITTFELG